MAGGKRLCRTQQAVTAQHGHRLGHQESNRGGGRSPPERGIFSAQEQVQDRFMNTPEPLQGSVSRRAIVRGGISVAALTALGVTFVSRPAYAAGGGRLWDPWAGNVMPWNWNWNQHKANSANGEGGQDFDLSYGTALQSPGTGILVDGGDEAGSPSAPGRGQWTKLVLDVPVERNPVPLGTSEPDGPLVSVAFQHQSRKGSLGARYSPGQVLGYSGNSGNVPAHLHVHGFNADGSRVDFMKYINAASAAEAGQGTTENGDQILEAVIIAPNGTVCHFAPGIQYNFTSAAEYETFRQEIDFLRDRGAATIMPLTPLSNAVQVTWDTYSRLCRYFNVPG